MTSTPDPALDIETCCQLTAVSPAVRIVITLGYWIFALQVLFYVLTSGRRLDPRSVLALGSLVIVFAFCGLCGYLSALLPWLREWREAAHWILAAATGALIITNQAQAIARMLSVTDLPPPPPLDGDDTSTGA